MKVEALLANARFTQRDSSVRVFPFFFFFFLFRDLREMALPKAKEIIVSGGKVKACSPDLFNCFGFPSTTMPAMRYGL